MVMEKGGIGNNKLKISEKVSLSYNNMTVLYFLVPCIHHFYTTEYM